MCALAVIVAIASGCTSEPPKCADQATLTILRQLLAGEFGFKGKYSEAELSRGFGISAPRPVSFDESIRKYSCEAQLTVSDLQVPLRYESQMDDNNQHLVSVERFAPMQILMLRNSVTAAFAPSSTGARDAQNLAARTEAPDAPRQAAPAPLPDVVGRWKGQLEGNGEMEIRPREDGDYQLSLRVSTESGCAGSVSGRVLVEGPAVTLSSGENGGMCTVRVKFSGASAEIEEDGCTNRHGAACGFSGTLTRE